jgi:pimeloyl-ACP methyl ester carboxylesterase
MPRPIAKGSTPVTTKKTIEVRGCKIGLMRAGAGETMLYLHGAGGAPAWAPFMAKLAERFDLVVPEHPGFGGSDTPDWLVSVGDLAFFYLDFIKQLGLKRVHLVGSSLGGWTALELAIRSTHDLATLTVNCPAGLFVPGAPVGDIFLWSPEKRVRNLVHDRRLAEQMLAVKPSEAEADIQMKNHYALARLAWQPRFFDPQLERWLHRIDVPTHIVWGKEDRLIPVAHAGAYAKRIPGAKVSVLAACGHLPHIEKTEDYVRLVSAFCLERRP